MRTLMTHVFLTVSSGKEYLRSEYCPIIHVRAACLESGSSRISAVPNPMTLRYFIPH